MRKVRTWTLALASALLSALACIAVMGQAGDASQRAVRVSHGKGKEPPPEVRSMLRQVDSGRIEGTIRKLVSFGTRNTLSSQDDPNRGIGAARDWIKSQFDEYAQESGGRMSVELQSYVQPVASRIPVPTTITNVVATLRGTQAESTDRVYVISGHYDSICTNPTDTTCDAPG